MSDDKTKNKNQKIKAKADWRLKRSQWAYECLLLATWLGERNSPELVTWADLDSQAGFDTRRLRHVTCKARRDCFRTTGKVYVTVVGKGIRLAADQDKVALSESFRQRIHRQARRGLEVASSVEDVGSMSDSLKADLNTGIAQLAVTRKVSSAAARKKIHDKIVVQGQIPSSKVLELFR